MAEDNEKREKGNEPRDNLSGEAAVEPRKVIYEWKSDQRAFKKLNKKQFLIVLAAVLVFMVALAILGHYWFMGALAALMFLLYAVGTIPPAEVTHVITNLGVETNNLIYEWEKLDSYWFSDRDGQKMLYIDTRIAFPGRLIILVNNDQLMKVHEAMKNRLTYQDRRGQSRYSSFMEGTWVDMLGGNGEETKDSGKEGAKDMKKTADVKK